MLTFDPSLIPFHETHRLLLGGIAPRPIAFAALSRYVRRPTGQMPPYTAKVVSDQELADIYAFLLTIPSPPAANTIPILAR